MPNPPFALRMLAFADCFGAREELVGDVLEEISHGRSRWWLYQQLIGLFGLALTAQLRKRALLTPPVIALGLSVVLLVALSIAPTGNVLVAWLGCYCAAGTLSLFGLMVSGSVARRGTVSPPTAETPEAG